MSFSKNAFAALLSDDGDCVPVGQQTAVAEPEQHAVDFDSLQTQFSEAMERLQIALTSGASKRDIKRFNQRVSILGAKLSEEKMSRQQHALTETVVPADELISFAPKPTKEQTCCACKKTEMSTYMGRKPWKCSECFGKLQEYSCCRCGSSFKTAKAINPRSTKCRSCFTRKQASYADFV